MLTAGATLDCPRLAAGELPVPKISEVTRVDSVTRPNPQDAATSTFILKTPPHPTLGDAYVILTDHTNEGFLGPLRSLAEHHRGTILQVRDLRQLSTNAADRDQLKADLLRLRPRYVAAAPRLQNFSEDMLLGLWTTLSALDDKAQLPVFPGLLLAPDEKSFKELVESSIRHKPQPGSEVHPFVMGQVIGPMPPGMRSVQKVRMMRNLFAEYGWQTPGVVVRAFSAVQMGATVAAVPQEWQVDMAGPGQFVKSIPAPAKQSLDEASLLVMYGHGEPGMACSLEVGAFQNVKMTGKVVLCGACYSAVGPGPEAGARPGGGLGPPAVGNGECFAMRAVENGAVVVFGHMRENAGFPHLFPVLEEWMDGLTVGEAYQRLINALKAGHPVRQDTNALLYVIIGDPALQPLEKMTPIKP